MMLGVPLAETQKFLNLLGIQNMLMKQDGALVGGSPRAKLSEVASGCLVLMLERGDSPLSTGRTYRDARYSRRWVPASRPCQ